MNARQLSKLVESIPSRVRIKKNVSYEIVFIDEFVGGKTLGECRYDTKQIIINKNQSKTEILRTTLHEIVHAIAMENNIKLTETHVLGLEDGLFRFLKLNNFL
jgi:hypothetical protein